jgi:hypothetical protein
MLEFDPATLEKLRSSTARMCYVHLVNYMFGLERQLSRILLAKRRLDELEAKLGEGQMGSDWERETRDNTLGTLMDVHFYLVCADKVGKLMNKIAESEADESLQIAWERARQPLASFKEARNHFEHMDERAERHGPDFGTFGSKWTFRGVDYDIGASGYRQVTQAVDAFLLAVRSRI